VWSVVAHFFFLFFCKVPNSTKSLIDKSALLRETSQHATLPAADVQAQATLVATAVRELRALAPACAEIESSRAFLNDESLQVLAAQSPLPPLDRAVEAQVGEQTRALDRLVQQHVGVCDELGELFFSLDAQLAAVEQQQRARRRPAHE
jgi:hypothetical protein